MLTIILLGVVLGVMLICMGCVCAVAASNKLKSDEEKARDDDEQMEYIENMRKAGKIH